MASESAKAPLIAPADKANGAGSKSDVDTEGHSCVVAATRALSVSFPGVHLLESYFRFRAMAPVTVVRLDRTNHDHAYR